VLWPVTGGGLLLGAWALTGLARRWNRRDRVVGFYLGLMCAAVLAVAGGGAFLAGPWLSGLAPTRHVYPAIVWVLAIWTTSHAALGLIMQLYCIARRLAGRMTARYDIDITNVALYWHFTAMTAVVTVAVMAGFPLLV
jgi:cytochrome c oxidase subunit I+III